MKTLLMRNHIGRIYEEGVIPQVKIDALKIKIKGMLQLDTVEIAKGAGGYYNVTTDDVNIIDFHIDTYYGDKLSLIKYQPTNEAGNRVDGGEILTYSEIKAQE